MSSFENHKIIAAVLLCVFTIVATGFFADFVMPEEELEQNAVTIDMASSGGAAKTGKTNLPESILALLASADIEKGAKIAKTCTACHSFNKGGPIKQGPNLWNIINSPKASNKPFGYSDSLKALGGIWDYSSLNKFLWKPKKYAPGTKMTFLGIKKTKDRAALVAWLRDQADTPAALPTEEEITAVEPVETE